MKTAGKPSQPIEKSTAGASLLTQVIVAKYADHLPLHRQAKIFNRFGGHLQADAYVVYDSFFTDPGRGIVEVGCWAHARRHFHNALEKDQTRMGGVLAMIAHLYAVEQLARQNGLSGDALRVAREQDASPMLERMHEYLLTIREQVLPKSEAGQAIAYTLKNWVALTRYCSDGDLPIDNNGTERSLRSFAVGRNNWTFFGSDNGGKTAAVLCSFVSSCELVSIDPFAWFKDILSRIAEHPIQHLEELLPHRWAQAAA